MAAPDLSVLQALAEEAQRRRSAPVGSAWESGQEKRDAILRLHAAISPETVLFLIGRARRADELEAALEWFVLVAHSFVHPDYAESHAFEDCEADPCPRARALLGRGDT